MNLFSSSPSFTSLAIFLFFLVATEARINLPANVSIPALFGFGDSIIDPGNNDYIKTLIKCNFHPYGKDYVDGPTGRFSNGKIPTDMIVEELGIKSHVPPYLDPTLTPQELQTGVSFASGAAGFDPLTSSLQSAIPLSQQLLNFKKYIEKLTAMVGEERAKFVINNSVYLVVAGSDDVANTYFDTPFVRRAHYDFNGYTDLMLRYASSYIMELYGLGARRIAMFNIPPIGCVPSQRTIGSFPTRMCAEDYNTVAQMFNSKLQAKIESLRSKYQDFKIVYVDVYNPLLDIIKNPAKYGIEEVTRGCCGTGLIEATLLCNKFKPVCKDDTKYLFWDSYHPTQRGYEILNDKIMINYIKSLI